MTKVVKFPGTEPLKFGLQKARKRKSSHQSSTGQLSLFERGKVIKLGQFSNFEEALVLDEGGDTKRAYENYQRAIAEGENLADANCNLGILESQSGNTTKAIDYFTQALKADPRHYESHYNLANIYAEVGNYPLAKVHYSMAIEIEPDFPNSYFNLGLTLAVNKEFAEAVETLQQYLRLVPQGNHRQVHDLIDQLTSFH
ncbi:MAG: tetratricopeptide repeat protein [Cyclobacteriaceae bacterium]|nr:tetratricopeptide repeat protein [Cyclobacteriaceae bacterium]